MLQVASQFRRKWLHDTECPEVRAIYKIVNTTKNFVKYEQYRFVCDQAQPFALNNIGGTVTAIARNPSTSSSHREEPTGTRIVGGTERTGNVMLEMRE